LTTPEDALKAVVVTESTLLRRIAAVKRAAERQARFDELNGIADSKAAAILRVLRYLTRGM